MKLRCEKIIAIAGLSLLTLGLCAELVYYGPLPLMTTCNIDINTPMMYPNPSQQVPVDLCFRVVNDGPEGGQIECTTPPPLFKDPNVWYYDVRHTYEAKGFEGHPDIPVYGINITYPRAFVMGQRIYNTETKENTYRYFFDFSTEVTTQPCSHFDS